MKVFLNMFLRNYTIVLLVVIIGHLITIGHLAVEYGVFPLTFLLELLAILLVIELLGLLIDKLLFDSSNPILKYLLNFIMTITVILIGWRILGWHEYVAIWFILISTTAIYIAAFLLDFNEASRDVAYINEKLRGRRNKEEGRKE